MRRALIGYSGFVGGNLAQAGNFAELYNSANFHDMSGQKYDEVVCAGVQAVKWWSNKNPDEDWTRIKSLLDVLETVEARRFVLISTVDVYRDPSGVDENSPVLSEGLHPYGLHRLRVENWVKNAFVNHSIVRLPGLFGRGLKKNLIFDILNDGDLSGFDTRSKFQFYKLSRLTSDLTRIEEAKLSLVNLAVEPISVGEIIGQISGTPYRHELDSTPMCYDMRSIHSAHWNQSGKYMVSAKSSLDDIVAFAQNKARDVTQ